MASKKTIFYWTCGICCFIGVILCIALPLASYESLEPNEVGLDYNSASVKIDESTLYTSGRHFIGLTNSFIKFPTEAIAINFDGASYEKLESRSKDGMRITVNANIQYRLVNNLNSILNLYYSFGESYEIAFVRVCRDAVRDTIATYNASDIVNDRQSVGTDLSNNIRTTLGKYYADLQDFQLIEIEFPTAFSSSISDTQNEILRLNILENNLEKTINDLKAAEAKAEAEAPAIVNEAIAAASLTRADAEASGIATEIRVATLQDNLL